MTVTDEDRDRARELARVLLNSQLTVSGLTPTIAAALAEEREKARAPFVELFSGGPDTACRTTWRRDSLADMPGTSIECVEVPMDDLRAAFDGEREKAQAPFLALAEELARVACDHHKTVAGDAYADSADRILAILEGRYP